MALSCSATLLSGNWGKNWRRCCLWESDRTSLQVLSLITEKKISGCCKPNDKANINATSAFYITSLQPCNHHWAPGNLTHILKQVLREVHSAVPQHAFLCDLINIFFFWIKRVCEHLGQDIHSLSLCPLQSFIQKNTIKQTNKQTKTRTLFYGLWTDNNYRTWF